MEIVDVEISTEIYDSNKNKFRVVGIDQAGTAKKTGPLVILHTGQTLNLKELKEFHLCK